MEQQIIDLYQQILLRTPNQDEIDYWLSVEADTSLAFVQQSIAASPEGVEIQTIVLPVIGLYQGLLGRAPEGEGFAFWVNAIAAGDLTIQNLIDEFAGSDEFQDANPELGDDVSAEELATIFYQNLLGRAPDAAGLEFWTDLLESGELTPASFTSAFIMTPETQERIGDAIVNYVEDIRDGDIDDPDNEGDLGEDDGGEEPGGEEPGGEEPGGEEPGGEEPGGEEPGGGSGDNDADVGNNLVVAITEESLNSSEQGTVGFTVAGLDGDADAVVTFTDSVGGTATVNVTADGMGTADLVDLSDGTITATIVARDDDGNRASGVGDTAVLDAVDPTLAISVSADDVNEDGTVTVTFTFSEAPAGFAAGDVTVTDGSGTIGDPVVDSSNPLVYTATFTPTADFDGDAVISVADGAYTDAAGNSGTGGSATINVDAVDPTLAISVSADDVNEDGTVTVTFTFSEAPAGFAAGDVTVTDGSGTIGDPVVDSSNPLVYTATFTPTADFDGDAVISVADDAYTDAAGNLGTGGSATINVDAVDPVAPTFTAASAFENGIAEDTTVNTVVGTLTSEAGVTFTIAPGSRFALDTTDTDLSDGQRVLLNEELDFEATGGTTASFSATAADAAGNISEVTNPSITVINAYTVTEAYNAPIDLLAQDGGSGIMWNGTTNPATNFAVVRVDTNEDNVDDIEIALGAQIHQGPALTDANGTGTYEFTAGDNVMFKWSISNLSASDASGGTDDANALSALLDNYDFKLFVDGTTTMTDAPVELVLGADATLQAEGKSGFAWDFPVYPARLIDDQGGPNEDVGFAAVTQNIQALTWYNEGVVEGLSFSTTERGLAAGDYQVSLKIYEDGTTNLVAESIIHFIDIA